MRGLTFHLGNHMNVPESDAMLFALCIKNEWLLSCMAHFALRLTEALVQKV